MVEESRPIRCAIYTRKSHEEGLDQAFNSLDAQREACSAYITSQRTHGWIPSTDTYDDGGFSGGNVERPALKRLIADITAGRIDVVVVYKIDRLSRSLLDFLNLIKVFETHKISFVSVTQSFDTSSPMGKLMLNVLLSFAQFEREITGERIRDKIAASKRKGMWMGGIPPFGYDSLNRGLVVNEEEAKLVRHIFTRFSTLGSITLLSRELRAQGVCTKTYTSRSGQVHTGKLMDKGFLYKMLGNRIYRGEITHKGVSYPGQHEAIIDQELWNQSHEGMQKNPRAKANHTRRQTPALLKGLLVCACCDRAMTPSHTRKSGGKLYRYYIPAARIKGNAESCHAPTVAAGEIERLIVHHLQGIFQSPEVIVKTWQKSQPHNIGLQFYEISTALQNMGCLWNELFPAEQARIVHGLVQKIIVSEEGAFVQIRTDGLSSLVHELGHMPRKAAA